MIINHISTINFKASRETATEMTEMIKNVALDANLGNHVDVSA